MKQLLLFCFLTMPLMNLKGQDVIITNSGTEIEAIVLEVGLKEVRYKKFSNQEGPIYVILQSDIFQIRYKNGSNEIFKKIDDYPLRKAVETPEIKQREGSYLGFHLGPGTAAAKETSPFINNFGFNVGLDYCYYLSDYVGLETGFSFSQLPIIASDFGFYASTITSIGIPIKIQVSTLGSYGFFYEGGFGFNVAVPPRNTDRFGYQLLRNPRAYVSIENSAGLHIRRSERINYKIGLFANFAITNPINIYRTSARFFGLQLGALYKLGK